MKGNGKITLKVVAFALIILLPAVTPSFAKDNTEPLAQPLLPMVRAMGAAYTAVADDENAVFYNPAGYGTIENGIVSVFSLDVKANVDDPAMKLVDALISGTNITSPTNISKYLTNTTIAPGISGPIYFGRVGNNFGFAFYDNVSVYLSTRSGAILPTGEFSTHTDLGFVGGYGSQLPFLSNLYGGINFKVILRAKSELEGTVLELIDSLGKAEDVPLAKSVGFGADVGLLYKPIPWLSFGLTAKDFFGTYFKWERLSGVESFPKSSIKPRIAFGIALSPLKAGIESKSSTDLVIALDYSDLLDYSAMLSNIKFGVKLSTLRIIDLLGGFDGGYLTGGVGFNLKIFHMGFYYFVDEMGSYPGANPVQNFVINLAFKW